MKFIRGAFLFSASLGALVLFAGCPGETTPTPQPVTPAATDDHGHEHAGHGVGPHEGTVADWGGGAYHVEFTVDHDKQEATVFVLGDDEKTASPVQAADGMILLAIDEPAFQVDLVADPMEGEADGTSSRYVGKHESLGVVREFSGTISAEVDGTPYAGTFKEEPHGAHDHE